MVCAVHGPDERDVGAVGEVGMRFDLGAHGAPIEIEILHRHGALRVAHPDQGDVVRAGQSGNAKSQARISGRPMFISNSKRRPAAGAVRKVLMPAPVRTRTSPSA